MTPLARANWPDRQTKQGFPAGLLKNSGSPPIDPVLAQSKAQWALICYLPLLEGLNYTILQLPSLSASVAQGGLLANPASVLGMTRAMTQVTGGSKEGKSPKV